MNHEPEGVTTVWTFDRPPPGSDVRGHIVLTFRFRRDPDDDGFYVGDCVEFGTSGFGTTIEEASQNTLDATAAYLEGLDEVGERERVFSECGIQVHTAIPSAHREIEVEPGEFVSTERLSELVDA